MDCTDFNGMLDNYANLTDAEKAEIDVHALNCPNCKSELEFYRSIMDTMSTLPTPRVPLDLLDRVNERIDNLPVYTKLFDGAYSSFKKYKEIFAAAAACAAVGVAVGLNSDLITDNIDDSQYIPPVAVVSDADNHESEPEITEGPEPQINADEHQKEDIPVHSDVADKPITTSAPIKPTLPAAANAAATAKSTQKHHSSAAAANKPAKATEVPQPEPEPTADDKLRTERTRAVPAQEDNNSSKYVIPRDGYHMPEVASVSGEMNTDAPAAYSADFVSEYELAMSDTPIDEKLATRNKLIVSNDDIQSVLDCMNECGVTSTSNGYWASLSVLNSFLQKLDEQGIDYTYAQTGSDGAGVQFMLFGI